MLELAFHMGTRTHKYLFVQAIRDGVIEASICHEGGYLQSHLQADVYATWEAAGALQERTRFCLDLAKSSTRAMRYPARRYRDPLETEQERRQREQIELDTARDLQDEFDDVI